MTTAGRIQATIRSHTRFLAPSKAGESLRRHSVIASATAIVMFAVLTWLLTARTLLFSWVIDPEVHGLKEKGRRPLPRTEESRLLSSRARMPSLRAVRPAPAAKPSRAQSEAARRRIRPGARKTTSTRGTNGLRTSRAMVRAILIPLPMTDRPARVRTELMMAATTSDQAAPTPYMSRTERQLMVRVRARRATTMRHTAMKAAGTAA